MPHTDFTRPRVLHAGFTLIEVMITVAIVAILSMVAVPSYREYVLRGNIPDATSNLSTKQVQMEQFFQDNRGYVNALGVAGPGCTADTTSSRYFDFTCTDGGAVVTANAFVITAVGKNSMAGFKFTINQAGARATPAVASGWTTSASCWMTKKAGTC